MTTREVTADQLRHILRSKLEGAYDQVELAAVEAVTWGEARAVALTNEHGLVDLGQYKRGWLSGPIPGGGELVNGTPHAPVIEYGRRPGRPGPPFAPIFEWVLRKLDVTDEDDARAIAWAIRNKIHLNGSAPHGILAQTYDEMRGVFRKEAQRRMKRLMKEVSHGSSGSSA